VRRYRLQVEKEPPTLHFGSALLFFNTHPVRKLEGGPGSVDVPRLVDGPRLFSGLAGAVVDQVCWGGVFGMTRRAPRHSEGESPVCFLNAWRKLPELA